MRLAAQAVNDHLDSLMAETGDPEDRVIQAMRYASLDGGKRLRPFLVMQSASLFTVANSCALNVAAALEMIHCYSLVHDDLPAMDNDDLRRGRPTVHRKWDEATAILAGDGLLTKAFEVLALTGTHSDPSVRCELVTELALASGARGMIGGQMIDLMAERGLLDQNQDMAAITRMHAMKTGRLIGFGCVSGAILGKAARPLRQALGNFSRDLGLAFQIADDILDVEGSTEELGKTAGKDQAAGKVTFVSLLGLERAREQARMLADQAVRHLEVFDEKADLLRAVARFVVERQN
ncbi:polyprenyl synthetase family protein [Phaeovibrio sulfidiphilus]|uniref:Polyprenyl synthetase family protein n=1 Tax=Phaeovibrio sulfidiphilus TaxID=1220600 RepID=A0A8J6YMN6_9PROT|nr:farnesyl diphosphate synthase [Phaeovibrio sulfidiphilus]MBE1237543.1 polyprenyl synthetase family protein [Phaeovibrio sulfidiphilus]